MSVIGVLGLLFVQPLLLIYAEVFRAILRFSPDAGWNVILFSLVLNLCLLPVYYQMERAGREGAGDRAAMDAEVARIKAHYRGRERYFYVRTLHRVYRHSPISVVFRSADLYLQILVFATVYRFLSTSGSLEGARFLGIEDLGRPDGLLGRVNLLPIVMTLLNVLSAMLYGRDRQKRRNAFLLAGLFLVLLYASPAGLVLYWTSNNLFSLVRNLVERKLAPALPRGVGRAWARLRDQV